MGACLYRMKITIVLGLKRSHSGGGSRASTQDWLPVTPCYSCPGHRTPWDDGRRKGWPWGSFGLHHLLWGSSVVKNVPAVQKTWVRSLGWEDPLKKGMATHSSILAWEIPWTEGLGRYSPWGPKELDSTERPALSPTLRFFRNNCLWCKVTDVSLNGWIRASVMYTCTKSWRTPKISYDFVDYTSTKLGDKKELLLSP